MLSILQLNGHDFAQGFVNTLIASAIALVASFVTGSLVGILQTSRHPLGKRLATIYVEFFRNVPLLIIVMFFYVVVPLYGPKLSGFQAGVIALTLYTSSFIADIIRGGILATPKGQFEAGISQGFTGAQVMRYLIFPQVIRHVIPPLGNQVINLIKNSSILAVVAGLDLMYYGDLVASANYQTIATYTLVGCLYLLITVPVTFIIHYLERRYAIRGH